MYFVRRIVMLRLKDSGTEELKTRYKSVDTVLRNGNDYYFCEKSQERVTT